MAGGTLVAAVGHAWLSDEAFGLKVLQELDRRGVPPGTVLADWSFGTITAYQRLSEGEFACGVFIGPVSRGRAPGLYRRSIDDPLPGEAEIHARVADCAMGLVSLENLIIMARYYGVLPRRVVVFEAEPLIDTWSDQLSPPLAALVSRAADDILRELAACSSNP